MDLIFTTLDEEAGDSALRLRQKIAASWSACAAAAVSFNRGTHVQVDDLGNAQVDDSGNVQVG